mgnify:CR=1 FL=1
MSNCVIKVLVGCCKRRKTRQCSATVDQNIKVAVDHNVDFFTEERIAIDNAIDVAMNAANAAARASKEADDALKNTQLPKKNESVDPNDSDSSWTTIDMELSRSKSV